MSFEYINDARGLVFDDQPMEALLYGSDSTAPSPASAFVASYPLIEEVRRGVERKDLPGAVKTMAQLMETDFDVPLWACKYFVSELQDSVPNRPRPIVSPVAAAAEPVFYRIFEYLQRVDAPALVLATGDLLYRFYESVADYGRARSILRVSIAVAKTEGAEHLEAQLINNYAYEYLLEENFLQAEEEFLRALKLFECLGHHGDVLNTGANLLTTRFGTLPHDRWSELLAELKRVNRALSNLGDWRARKTLMLLARHAEARGLLRAAAGWARRAVKAAGNQPSQHRLDDAAYLEDLESRRSGKSE